MTFEQFNPAVEEILDYAGRRSVPRSVDGRAWADPRQLDA
jgi:hypothetical protein